MKTPWQMLALVSIATLGMGVFALTLPGVPALSSLLKAEGDVSWVRWSVGSVRFRLKDNPETFYYSTRTSGGYDELRAALNSPDPRHAVVLYDPRFYGPVFFKQKHHQVLDLALNGRSVRSFAETSTALKKERRFSTLLGAAMLVGGIILAYRARQSWKAQLP